MEINSIDVGPGKTALAISGKTVFFGKTALGFSGKQRLVLPVVRKREWQGASRNREPA